MTVFTVALAVASMVGLRSAADVQYGDFTVVLDKSYNEGGPAVRTTFHDPCSNEVEKVISTSCRNSSLISLFDVRSAKSNVRHCGKDVCPSEAMKQIKAIDYSVRGVGEVELLLRLRQACVSIADLFSKAAMILMLSMAVKAENESELDGYAQNFGYHSYADLDVQSKKMVKWKAQKETFWKAVKSCALRNLRNGKEWEMYDLSGRVVPQPEGGSKDKSASAQYLERTMDEDDKSFVDHRGNSCLSWYGFDCKATTVIFKFSIRQQEELLQKCPKACSNKVIPHYDVSDDAMINEFRITRYNDTDEEYNQRINLYDHAVTRAKCLQQVRSFVDYAVNQRPWFCRDEADRVRTEMLMQVYGDDPNTDKIIEGVHSGQYARTTRVVVRRIICAGLLVSFTIIKLMDLGALIWMHATVPVMVWCESDSDDLGGTKIDQHVVHCLFRGDQSDSLGMLGLTCKGCELQDEPTRCPYNCDADSPRATQYQNGDVHDNIGRTRGSSFWERALSYTFDTRWRGSWSPLYYHEDLNHRGATDGTNPMTESAWTEINDPK